MYIAEILAEVIRPGDTVLLYGEIGSGKTFFSRAMIQKMMEKQGAVVEDIPSPTFTIVQIYDTLVPSVWHLDLYRISNPDEIIDLDLENALEKHVCLIEWPQNMGLHVPERNISISLEEILGSDFCAASAASASAIDPRTLANLINIGKFTPAITSTL